MAKLNILTFLISYFLISFSVLGYGLFLEKFFEKKREIGKDLGFTGILGIFFLILYSFISHNFISHNLIHNTFLFFIGLSLFILLFKNLDTKNNLIILSLLLLISFIGLLIYKTHDDFHYYHFPYSIYLTEHPSFLGIGQFNHGFRTPSSIFYLNSLLYLPLVKYFTFYIFTTLFLVFSNLILLSKIIEKFKIKDVNYIAYLCLLFFIFINIFFYRIQEHGTDRSAQILIFVLIIYLISFISFENEFKRNISKIFIVSGIIISLKALYLLYLLLSIPIIYILYKEKKLHLINQIIKDKFFWLFLILLANVLFIYFINTGCLIYPASFTCFDNFSWALSEFEINKMKIHYENWSKGGHTPNFKVDDPVNHIKYFNWLPNWIEVYFFNKMSDFILGIIFLMIFVGIFFYKKNKNIFNFNENINLILITIFVFFLEWFYNHPSLRYGGYCLIVILFFLPFSSFLQKNANSIKEKKYKFSILICITLVIFLARNISRINQEMEKYSYKPFSQPNYQVGDLHFRINDKLVELIENFKNCENNVSSCKSGFEPKMRKIFTDRYIFVYKK